MASCDVHFTVQIKTRFAVVLFENLTKTAGPICPDFFGNIDYFFLCRLYLSMKTNTFHKSYFMDFELLIFVFCHACL